MKKNIYMVDSSAPFFVRKKQKKEQSAEPSINWSKAPTHDLLKNNKVRRKTHKKIREGFQVYVKRLSKLGYNSLSIDEAAYLLWPVREVDSLPIRKWVQKYRKYYRKLFRIALEHGMTPYLTADVWYFVHTPEGAKKRELFEHMARSFRGLLKDFPELGGIILRVGESDGVDVESPFRSQLMVKTAADLRKCLQTILPAFQETEKTLIFRTWTLGAGKIGDLLWNRNTLLQSLPVQCLSSDNFLLSYKFSQSDFTRYQKLNPYALNSPAPYILELQTRREYEGFGEFPCFVGFDYSDYARQLRNNSRLRGIHVWCQTGGWSRFKNYSFLKSRSYWNELNTAVTVHLFRSNGDLDASLLKAGYSSGELIRIRRFLQLSDDLIKHVLYIPSFASRELYLNRSRIPSLIHVLWDRITVTSLLAELVRIYSGSAESDWHKSCAAMDGLSEMEDLARKLKLRYRSRFHRDTMQLFQLSQRALLFTEESAVQELQEFFKKYSDRYPGAYDLTVRMEKKPGRMQKALLGFLFKSLIRTQPEYRFRDRAVFGILGPVIVHILLPMFRKYLPDTLDQQAMPVAELIG